MPEQGDPEDGDGGEDAPASGAADEPNTDDEIGDAGHESGGTEDASGDEGDAGTGGGDVGAGGGDDGTTGGGGNAGGGNAGATGGGGGNAGGGGRGLAPDEQYCSSCGEPIKKEAEICPHCGVRNKSGGSSGGRSGSVEKDRSTAGILAILLGWIGAHKFYLNETGLGLIYLCFFWTGIPFIIGIIEGIIYLTKTDEEFKRQYVN